MKQRTLKITLSALTILALVPFMGCSSNADFSGNDTKPKAAANDTGQHSPPPMAHKIAPVAAPNMKSGPGSNM